MGNARFKLTLYGCVVYVCCIDFASLDVQFAINFMIVPVMFICSSFLISVCMFIVSKTTLLISSATVIFCTGGANWLNALATVIFSVCNTVTVECCVLYPCCVVVFGMFSVM